MRVAVLLVALVTLALPAAAEQSNGPAGPNLVRNASFEQVEDDRIVGWEGPGDVLTCDAGAASDGARSLKFVNTDAGCYAPFTQTIPLEPGRIYEVRAKVRTQGVAGDDSGATVHLPAAHRVTMRDHAVPVGTDGLPKANLASLGVDIYRVEKQ
jgi:hypothetical protein